MASCTLRTTGCRLLRSWCRFTLATIPAVLFCLPLNAQSVEVGTRVRLATVAAPSSSDWIVGTWELPVATQLVLRDQDGSIRRLARDSVRRVQVSEGRGSSTGQGALLGLAVGTAAGVLVQLGSCAGSGEGTLCIAHGYVLFGATGAALGSAVGAIIGALTKRELWRDVEPASLR